MEDYVSFKVAKILKEKGFNICCQWLYLDDNHPFLTDRTDDCRNYYKNSELAPDEYSAPTHQMAMKWLREVHKILIVVGSKKGDRGEYRYSIKSIRNDAIIGISDRSYIHYEEAVESALEYCLTNLV